MFTGCTGTITGDTAQYIERPRPETKAAVPDGASEAYLGFSEELFRTAASEAENPLISPASAYFALAMAANGAAGETKTAFEKTLGLSVDELNAVCLALMNNLSMTAGSTKLSVANSVWVDMDEDFDVSEEYISFLQNDYYAEYTETDLQTARQAVNAWVKYHTEGMIPEMLSEQPDRDARLLLINTLYLKTAWETEFDPNSTQQREFHTEGGGNVSAEFLYSELGRKQCILTPEATGVVLPYDDGKLAFIALKPNEGTVRGLLEGFDGNTLAGYLAAAKEKTAWLAMPKFTREFSLDMQAALTDMGLGIVFEENADFSGIAPDICISRVLQKTRVDVHEKGTEAAAATVVEMSDSCAVIAEDPVELCFDSPYLYAIVDMESGLPLFMGIMDDPA